MILDALDVQFRRGAEQIVVAFTHLALIEAVSLLIESERQNGPAIAG
jgi:hypothetical protein